MDTTPLPKKVLRLLIAIVCVPLLCLGAASGQGEFEGKFYRGVGDTEYLRLLDVARRMFSPDLVFQNLPMLYMPSWNGLVEGPTWDAWWVQNSYGTTYSALPFLQEPFVTFLQNSQDLWFDQMGDGKRVGAAPPFNWVAPDGCLCDAARPGWIVYRQGDGRTHLHDWGMEFTAAGLLMQSELLLVGRDSQAVAKYLPKLERCARFIETRRDPAKHLFLAGAAGNLLAPSFAGWKRPDGSYGQAYLTGLSVTYIAALERLVELEKLTGRPEEARLWKDRQQTARQGLAQLTTDEGYLINSLDPDGTRHGVFGAAKHGYFESSPNHDAIAFRVVDDAQAQRIYSKIASIPQLRPHQFIIPNFPSYDDMYEKPEGLWGFGTWVNGGHWSTCEARMVLGYYRLGHHEDARRSMLQILSFAERFRMDNPLVKFGSDVYQPNQPINLTYDAFGPPAAFIRGLFECLYRADTLTLLPHIPEGISRLEQRFPIRFGAKRLFIATVGKGTVTSVQVNGKPWRQFTTNSVVLPYDEVPETACIEIGLGGSKPLGFAVPEPEFVPAPVPPDDAFWRQLAKANLSSNGLPLRIGADSNGGSRFSGDIACARVFGRALSASEISSLASKTGVALPKDALLVAGWSFDTLDNDSFVSSAGKGLRAKAVGDVKQIDALAGKAVRFDGGYLEVAKDPTLDLREAVTLEAWICPRELPPAGARIIDKSEVGSSNGYLLDTYPGNSLRLICQAGTLSYDAKLALGRWTHVAATVTPDGELTLYVDGKSVAQRRNSSAEDIPTLLALGKRLANFHRLLQENGEKGSYEALHTRLALECLSMAHERLKLLKAGKLKPLNNPVSAAAADQLYVDTAAKLANGLSRVLDTNASSPDPRKQKLSGLWNQSAAGSK
jgi:hypothetical protein